MSHRVRPAARYLIAAFVVLASCHDSTAPVRGVVDVAAVSRDRVEATGSTPSAPFAFLAPLGPTMDDERGKQIDFDRTLAPIVDICELDDIGAACRSSAPSSASHWRFARVSAEEDDEREAIRVRSTYYELRWQTRRYPVVAGARYQVRVTVGTLVLGDATVTVVATERERESAATAGAASVARGATLPVRFRIAHGVYAERVVTAAAGGTLTNGVAQVVIPAGAVTQSASLSVQRVPLADLPASARSGVIDGTVFDFGPSGTTFATPVAMAVKYDPALVGSVPSNTLRLFTLSSAGGWSPLLSSTVDPSTHLVSGRTLHFSEYAVLGAAAVSAGNFATCAISSTGTTSCWGDRILGSSVPQSVAGQFSGISTGDGIACGITSAPIVGTLSCWGTGFLGNPSAQTTTYLNVMHDSVVTGFNPSLTPVPVAGVAGLAFGSVSVGQASACAVVSASGVAYCWGMNLAGLLGVDPSTTTDCGAPTASGSYPCSFAPVQVQGAATFTSIAVGDWHACALSSGVAYCWGANASGQLGTGVIEAWPSIHPAPAPVQMPAGVTFTSIVAAASYSCALGTDAQAYCWGSGSTVGTGSASDIGTPTPVSGGIAFVSLTAGGSFACGLTAVTATQPGGDVYCWGGSVGPNGMLSFSGPYTRQPTPVALGRTLQSVSAGLYHACGVAAAPATDVYCWGFNNSGQIMSPPSGDLVAIPYREPVP